MHPFGTILGPAAAGPRVGPSFRLCRAIGGPRAERRAATVLDDAGRQAGAEARSRRGWSRWRVGVVVRRSKCLARKSWMSVTARPASFSVTAGSGRGSVASIARTASTWSV